MTPPVIDLADNRGAGGAGAGLAAVLFDDDRHAVVAGDRTELLEPLDPDRTMATSNFLARQHAGDVIGVN